MIDWSKVEQFPEQTCYCRCEAVYRSHAKIDMELRKAVSKKPCPKCGRNDDLRRVSHDPEYMDLQQEDIGSMFPEGLDISGFGLGVN